MSKTEKLIDELSDIGVEVMAWLDDTLCVAKANIDVLREQDLNAHYMPAQMFQQLSNNLRKRGIPESLPFCWYNRIDQCIEIISGHHRARAYRSAQITAPIPFLLETAELTREEVITKQLAHNAIVGDDDPSILKTLFAQIASADLQLETYINPDMLNIPTPDVIRVTAINMGFEFKAVSFFFLPYQMEDFDKCLAFVHKDAQHVFTAELKYFDKFKDAVLAVQSVDDIKSIGTTIARMSEIVLEYYAKVEHLAPSNT